MILLFEIAGYFLLAVMLIVGLDIEFLWIESVRVINLKSDIEI